MKHEKVFQISITLEDLYRMIKLRMEKENESIHMD